MIPAARTPGAYAIAAVCLGNICRSAMADVVLRTRLDEAGLNDVEVLSAGTGDWHVGEPMDPRAAATLRAAGYDPTRHRAQQWSRSWEDRFDLVLAMDAQNLADIGGADERTALFRSLDPSGPGDVPDPYFGGDEGFEKVLAMVERTADAIVAEVAAVLGASTSTTDAGVPER